MKYFSCFSWIWWFELWITQAYENNTADTMSKRNEEDISSWLNISNAEYSTMMTENPTCVGFSEIDKYATQIYQSHFPTHQPYGDITKIDTATLPDFDCLVWGFPCQAFSIAGKRRGFEDTRGTLFFELARILRAKQPRLFVFENVKGLLSHDNGKTFSTIIATIDELGYDCQWQVLNSKNHGVPQNRERVFIIWHLRGTARPKVFPIFGTSPTNNRIIKDGELFGDKRNFSLNNIEGISPTLMTATPSGRSPKANQSIHKIWLNTPEIRRLTPTECERLQWFPDWWTDWVSDTQRYKCLWNAVTVNVIRDIFLHLSPL